MKKTLMLALGLWLFTLPAKAQKESFDIASFSAPLGWKRYAGNESISFSQQSFDTGGPAHYASGWITIYASRPSSGDAKKYFLKEWKSKVRSKKLKAKPGISEEKIANGWTMITGTASYVEDWASIVAMLITVTGPDKTITISINLKTDKFLEDVRSFLHSLEFSNK